MKRLVEPIINNERNVTTDNRFTSVPLEIDLFNNNKHTLLETIKKKKKRQLPIEFTTTKSRLVYTSYFGFSEDKLSSYHIPLKKINLFCYYLLCIIAQRLIKLQKK